MTKNYIQVEEGKWYLTEKDSTFICCDCSLVHEIKFKIIGGRIFSKWKRNDRKTAGYRKGKEVKKIIKKLI